MRWGMLLMLCAACSSGTQGTPGPQGERGPAGPAGRKESRAQQVPLEVPVHLALLSRNLRSA